jgi:mycothiol synthase
LKLVALDASRAEALERLLAEPSLTSAFEWLARPGGVAEELSFPHLDHEATRLAYVDGELAAFVLIFVFPIPGPDSPPRHWSMIWLGVGERFRRRGFGDALLARSIEALRRPGVDEITLSAWMPADGCEELAARHGFRFARHFWLMERPLGGMAEPVWPARLEPRTFDGSDRAVGDLNAVYNDSFAEHYHFVPGTDAETRDLVASESFRADGLAMSYRGDRCVGFCRSTLLPARGEISMLGTSREARGIGLGRALLRWGVRWLEAEGAARVTLVVDGENESALALYRQEGFEVVRTRRIWSRALEA